MARSADPALRQWWRELLELFEGSSFTVADFCRQQGVSTASFYAWRRRLAGAEGSQSPKPNESRAATSRAAGPAFLPVHVASTQAGAGEGARVLVHLPGGVRVEVPAGQRELLFELLHAVGGGEAAR